MNIRSYEGRVIVLRTPDIRGPVISIGGDELDSLGGIICVPKAFCLNYRKLGIRDKDFALVLALSNNSYATNGAEIPSVKALSERLFIAPRTVQRGLKRMSDAGYLAPAESGKGLCIEPLLENVDRLTGCAHKQGKWGLGRGFASVPPLMLGVFSEIGISTKVLPIYTTLVVLSNQRVPCFHGNKRIQAALGLEKTQFYAKLEDLRSLGLIEKRNEHPRLKDYLPYWDISGVVKLYNYIVIDRYVQFFKSARKREPNMCQNEHENKLENPLKLTPNFHLFDEKELSTKKTCSRQKPDSLNEFSDRNRNRIL